MGRPDLVELSGEGFQMFQTPDVVLHIAVRTEHEDPAVLLNRVAAYEHPVSDVQHGDAPGGMTWQVDDAEFTPAEIQDISLADRDDGAAPAAAAEMGFLIRVHVEGFKLFVAAGMVPVGMGIQQHDREIHSTKVIFSKFDYFAQGFLQLLLRNIFTALWTLLFIIPGIVKSFAYAMTPFIMAENPDMSAKEAIKLSQEKMMGHKGELFWLGLTFFGWSLLASLTGGIGYIFLNPYMNAAYAAFYRDKIAPKSVAYTESYIPPQIDVTM